jgi:hypothetical protein
MGSRRARLTAWMPKMAAPAECSAFASRRNHFTKTLLNLETTRRRGLRQCCGQVVSRQAGQARLHKKAGGSNQFDYSGGNISKLALTNPVGARFLIVQW